MMKNSLKSSSPIVVPMEALRSANTFIAREANRSAIPFVSFAQPQTSETGFRLGNTDVPLFVPIIVDASGQNRVGEGIARLIMAEMVTGDRHL